MRDDDLVAEVSETEVGKTARGRVRRKWGSTLKMDNEANGLSNKQADVKIDRMRRNWGRKVRR